MSREEILKELADVVAGLKPKEAGALAEKALAAGLDPVDCINNGLVVGMGIVGDEYAARTMYLPQVLVAAHAMYNGLDVFLPAIPKGNDADALHAVTAVVAGDVHDIGKNIVRTLLTAGGYVVDDLGKDVPVQKICDAINGKAQVACLSTLMTPTMANMEKAVNLVKESGYREKVVITIGGPPTNDVFCQKIGADHRDENAVQAVKWIDAKLKG